MAWTRKLFVLRHYSFHVGKTDLRQRSPSGDKDLCTCASSYWYQIMTSREGKEDRKGGRILFKNQKQWTSGVGAQSNGTGN